MPNLPVPTPVSEVPGNSIAAALWNDQVYNGSTFVLNPPLFVGYQTSTQTIANGTWTAITLDTETVDSYNGHSNVTNSMRYTAQVAGWYTASGVVAFAGGTVSIRGARIEVNGSVVQGSAQMIAPPNATNFTGVATPPRTIYLNTGDYVVVSGYQLTGGSLSTGVATDLSSALWVVWAHT